MDCSDIVLIRCQKHAEKIFIKNANYKKYLFRKWQFYHLKWLNIPFITITPLFMFTTTMSVRHCWEKGKWDMSAESIILIVIKMNYRKPSSLLYFCSQINDTFLLRLQVYFHAHRSCHLHSLDDNGNDDNLKLVPESTKTLTLSLSSQQALSLTSRCRRDDDVSLSVLFALGWTPTMTIEFVLFRQLDTYDK